MCYVKASHLNQSTFIKNSFENTYSSYLQNRALPNHLHKAHLPLIFMRVVQAVHLFFLVQGIIKNTKGNMLLCVCYSLVGFRPRISHGFTMCHMVSLFDSGSHGSLHIFHGFALVSMLFVIMSHFVIKSSHFVITVVFCHKAVAI